MIVSNALPIQFWDVDEDTYNEKQVCGIESFCWCHPWQCDDVIPIQFKTDVGESVSDYAFALLDSDGVIVYDDTFTEVSSGVGALDIDLSQVTCGAKYQAVIYDAALAIELEPPSSWSDPPGGADFPFASKNSTQFIATSVTSFIWYRAFQAAVVGQGPEDKPRNITGHLTLVSAGGFILKFEYRNSFGGIVWVASLSGSGNYDSDFDLEFSTGGGSNAIELHVSYRNSVSTTNATITIVPGQITNINEVTIKKSDCLDVHETQECTELITYSNNKNFAGIVYEGITPQPEFSLRVPVVFFHESFPQEEEVHALSNDTLIRLSSRMQRKKNFDIGYIPYYMHQKIQLILMHDNIEIQGDQWKKTDSYNIEEAHKRYPKPKANVLLTDKNFIIRNLI